MSKNPSPGLSDHDDQRIALDILAFAKELKQCAHHQDLDGLKHVLEQRPVVLEDGMSLVEQALRISNVTTPVAEVALMHDWVDGWKLLKKAKLPSAEYWNNKHVALAWRNPLAFCAQKAKPKSFLVLSKGISVDLLLQAMNLAVPLPSRPLPMNGDRKKIAIIIAQRLGEVGDKTYSTRSFWSPDTFLHIFRFQDPDVLHAFSRIWPQPLVEETLDELVGKVEEKIKKAKNNDIKALSLSPPSLQEAVGLWDWGLAHVSLDHMSSTHTYAHLLNKFPSTLGFLFPKIAARLEKGALEKHVQEQEPSRSGVDRRKM